jgi:signal transduction histidine kinase
MWLFALGSFAIVIFNISLWFLIFASRAQEKTQLAKAYFKWSLFITLWALGYGITLSGIFEYQTTLIWNKLCQSFATMIGPYFFLFGICVADEYEKYKKIYQSYYAFGLINAILLFITPWYVIGLWSFGVFRYQPLGGPLYILFTGFFYWCTLHSFIIAVKKYRVSFGNAKKQIGAFLLATGIAYSGGGTLFLQAFKVPLPSYGIFLILAYVIIIGYAIHKYKFLDIELIIRKSIVFAGMFAFAFGVFVAIALLVSQFIAGGSNMLSFAISAFIITFLLRPIETLLINATDKFLFQKKYEYKEIIKKFIDEVVTELNINEIISSTLKLLDQALHPYAAAIFILNKLEDKYQLYSAYGLEDKNIILTSDSKLVTFLKKYHNPAVIKQIDGIAAVNSAIAPEMTSLKAVLVLPLMLHDDLIGFISLGRKKSDEEYTKDDLDVLQDLARTESIAAGNAQLLAEAAQAERRAAIGTMAAGINHEIGNPLNIINTKIQLFLAGVKRGLYQDKPKDEIVQECQNILNDTINQTNRIADITRRLSNFAKPSKEFKPESLIVLQEIEEALFMAGHELELDRIKINKEISAGSDRILADRREIQQIFFNIIRNAAQAIEGSGAIAIRVLSAKDGKVHIEIEDTGEGIPEDKIQRIFEPFFTTKGVKGTGLGLSIVRQLVWRNKGEISFKSQPGAGTTFILEFPKAEA